MLSAINWLWQLPQHLLGLLVILFTGAKKLTLNGTTIWVTRRSLGGVSLGQYIIVSDWYTELTVKHERGHSFQSMMLGPAYLLLVGLPSIVGNIWDRLFHRKWSQTRRYYWYYERYPENWADRLGGIAIR